MEKANALRREQIMLNHEHDVLFATHEESGLMEGTLQPGHLYMLHLGQLGFDMLNVAFDANYIDERIIKGFVKKIIADKEVPLFTFTRSGPEFKIVSGIHALFAASILDMEYVKGIYVSRSALEAEHVEQIFL